MPTTYNPERYVRIPTDARLYASLLFGAALGLLIVDSLDWDASILSRWGTFCALGGVAVMMSGLHSYTRRVIIEVMSWEHRQQGMLGEPDDGRQLSLIGDHV